MENELTLNAETGSIAALTSFVEKKLEPCGGSTKGIMQICVALDEIASNIINYSGAKTYTVRVDQEGNPPVASITFIDNGIPYDPLKKEDPDTTLFVEDREIGGLGIFLVKKIMDSVCYSRVDDKNILVIKKHL